MTYPENKNQPLKIALGTDNFKEMVTQYDIYVDKTLFIKEVLDSSEKAMLITYPRRWGKTLNLDMLKTFLEPETKKCKKVDQEEDNYSPFYPWTWSLPFWNSEKLVCNKDIFLNYKLAISKADKGYYMKYQGKHPVIFISLKEITGDVIEEIRDKLKNMIKSLYKDFRYILDSDKLYEDERADFQKYINIDYQGITLEGGIRFLSELLHKHHGEKVYILVDEYDKPINAFLEDNLGKEQNPEQNQLVREISKLISQTLCSPLAKTNPDLEKIILTGIFDTIYKEAGSGCNNVSPYGISDIKFSKNFGFSPDEVKKMVSKFPFENKEKVFDTITNWYDGYYIPVGVNEYIHAYTPWAVMKYLNTAYSNNDLIPQNYWTKSGASTILQRLFTKEKCLNSALSQKFLELSTKTTFKLKFDNQISLFKYDWYADVDNEEFFAYLLLNSGYFAVKKNGREFEFSIPNAELLEEFMSIIPKNDNNCKIILDNLEKSRYLKAVNMIKKDDSEGIVAEINRGNVDCNDYSMNFNFLQLSIMFASINVFKALQGLVKCKGELNMYQDQIFQLTSLDYAFILNRNEFLDYYKENNYLDAVEKLQNPSKMVQNLNYNICILLNNTVSNYVWTGVMGLVTLEVVGCIKNTIAVSYLKKAGIAITFAGRLALEKSVNIMDCEEIFEYDSTNITSSKDFDSLKQCKKYMIEEKETVNAYVTINNECNQEDKKLTDFGVNIFQNLYYSDEKILFTLCEGALKLEEV